MLDWFSAASRKEDTSILAAGLVCARTFDASPGTAVQLEGLQELLVLLIRPPLSLFGDGVGLAHLP